MNIYLHTIYIYIQLYTYKLYLWLAYQFLILSTVQKESNLFPAISLRREMSTKILAVPSRIPAPLCKKTNKTPDLAPDLSINFKVPWLAVFFHVFSILVSGFLSKVSWCAPRARWTSLSSSQLSSSCSPCLALSGPLWRLGDGTSLDVLMSWWNWDEIGSPLE